MAVAGVMAAVAVAGGTTFSPRSASAETRISLEEARDMAGVLLQRNRPQEALLLAEGILQGAPGDIPALVLKSRALRDLGRFDEAAAVAAEARDLAGTDKDRFFAALVTAQAQASSGKKGIAQYWLRRAAQVAPDDQMKALAIRDFRQVRRTTPYQLKLNFYTEPSDNLDGSPPEASRIEFGPFLALTPKPPSGVRTGGSAQLRYTVAISEKRRVDLEAVGGGSLVRLSSESRDLGYDADDFTSRFLGGRAQVQWRNTGGDALTHLAFGLSRYWQGGTPIADVGRFEGGYRWRLGDGLLAEASFGVQRQFRLDSDTDVDDVDIAFTLSRHFERTTLDVDLRGERTRSGAAILNQDSLGLGLTYAASKPVKGMMPRLTLGYEESWYETAPTFAGVGSAARHDKEWSASVDVLLPKLDYMGFAPEIGVSFRDRSSNYEYESMQSTDLRLGLKSVF